MSHNKELSIVPLYVYNTLTNYNNIYMKFKEKINHYAHKECKTKVLMVPPATGAIVWAMELATGKFPSLEEREQLIKTVEMILSRK